MSKKKPPVPVAVIGLSCWYPDARNPRQLWENILARRRQFRLFPDQRLPLSDYYHPDPEEPDKTYGKNAALIDGFEFDWASRRVTLSTYESTDIAHWLAFEVAIEAIANAGFDRETIPREHTGIIVGNTLTGEQTRSNAMRLRWPFVRRALIAASQSAGLSSIQMAETENRLELFYKSVFPSINEDSLAGGLSNTIAGRICNYLNVFGGGYTVDGACSSSLLAVATAATHLANGDLDLVLTGGVDISLDTFEMIGFSKTRALAKNDMNVYDRSGSGFIPGEGCGFVVLKRLEDARKDKNYIYAVVHGCGISSDGKSTGITAPSAQGQSRALKRAYAQAPYDMDSLNFLEGHGTGTTVGDRVELEGIAMAMGNFAGKVENSLRYCAITSLKSIIGHCKAAAGIGGFIKSVMAVNQRIVPPTAACQDPHPVFNTSAKRLYPAKAGEILDPDTTLRAGVSAMGFGGINCHVTLESGDAPCPKVKPSMPEKNLLVSNQHTELFLITADSAKGMKRKIENLLEISKGISIAELTDLAAGISTETDKNVRCAVIAGNPDELKSNLEEALAILREKFPNENSFVHNPLQKVWVGNNMKGARVGILFPGQGSQQLNMGRVLVERFTWAGDLLRQADKAAEKFGKGAVGKIIFRPSDRAVDQDLINNWQKTLSMTEYAQPAICVASLIWWRFLENLGLKASAVGGHSLGELTAFHAAGAISQQELFHLAALRGKAMAESGSENGKMITLRCSKSEAEEIVRKINGYLVIANINGPQQVVLSGKTEAVKMASEIAAESGIQPKEIPVFNAFHSKLASHAAQVIRNETFLNKKSGKISIRLFSSFMGEEVPTRVFLNHHFSDQIFAPVDFMSMIRNMAKYCDIFLEAGPGRVLTGLTNSITGDPGPLCYPIESEPFRDEDLNRAMASLFIHGVDLRWEKLYSGRLVRHFTPVSEKKFIENPCERPFDIAKVSGIPISLERSAKGTVEGLLAELINLSESELSAYLKTRGPFLAKVIEADLKHPAAESLFLMTDTKDSEVLTKETVTDLSTPESFLRSIETVVLANVEKITGFSPEGLNLEMRLLDDLNLDSIKATDLVVKISRDLTTDFSLEALDFAKASLRDIIKSLSESLDISQPIISEPNISDAFEIVMTQASQLTGYPLEILDADALVTHDLNIGPKQLQKIIESSSRLLKIDPYLDLEPLRERSLRQIASILSRMKKEQAQSGSAHVAEELAKIQMYDLDMWVRDFKVEMVETPFPSQPETGGKRLEDNWQNANVLILYDPDSRDVSESIHRVMITRGAKVRTESFAEALSHTRNQDAYPGPEFSMLVAILPQTPGPWQSPEIYLQQMIKQVSVIASPPSASQAPRRRTTVVYVQFGGGSFGSKQPFYHPNLCCASALAKSIHLERDDLRVRVLDFFRGIDLEKLAEKAITEIHTPDAFAAIGFDHELRRYVERPKVLDPATYHDRGINWSSEDVILVTGGARGITASIALGVSKETGAKMALVGSSPDPDKHPDINSSVEISQTLLKFSKNGLVAKYFSCDVSNKVSVEHLVGKILKELGNVTGVIHGAGLNKPRATRWVSVEDAFEEVSPKVLGVLNLMYAFEKSPPKLFAGISSVIGYTGMPRNAWYAFSNEVLDILLRKFRSEHPQTVVFSVAYSIWRDEGMGHRMGGVGYLKRQGIDAIATDEGVKRFVTLFKKDPGTDRIIVTARLGRINTFAPAPLPGPENVRYLEKAIYINPAIESIFQVHLSLENDPYLKDHSFRGSFLFPTVFGLEAMAQTAAHALGKTKLKRVRIENILLKRPITVDPGTGADILIQAQVQEKPDSSSLRKIRTKIFKRDTGILKAYFSAEFILDLKDAPVKKNILKPQQPLSIIPKDDLYRENLLFQGPTFQRIHKIFSIVPKTERDSDEAEEAIFTTEVFAPKITAKFAFIDSGHGHLMLGDPFFRDSLLQSAQILIPKMTCLPTFIEKLDIYPFVEVAKKTLTGIVRLEWRKEQKAQYSVAVLDDEGFVRENMEGYVLHLLKRVENNPCPAELINPEKRDNIILQKVLNSVKEAFGVVVPFFQLVYLPRNQQQQLTKDQRHEYEIALIYRVLKKALGKSYKQENLNIHWLNKDKPVISSLENSLVDISIFRDNRLCMCVAGEKPQGFNVAPVTSNSRQQWVSLIGKENEILLDALLEATDTIDCAGTRIWSVKETIEKTTGNLLSGIEISKMEKGVVLFNLKISDEQLFVLTFPLNLTWGPKRMFSLIVNKILEGNSIEKKASAGFENLVSIQAYENVDQGGPQGQSCFVHRFPISFKPNAQLSRTVYFSNYFFWLGEVREIGLWPSLGTIARQIATGKHGFVTNKSHMKFLGEATAKDQVEIRVWVTGNHGKSNSIMDLTFDYRKVLPGGMYERLAWCEQQVTWVKILDHGIVEPQVYPEYFREVVKTMLPKYDAPNNPDPMPEPLSFLMNPEGDFEQYRAPAKPVVEPLLFEKTIETSLDNSNIVGNIYFANYYAWQGQVRDRYFYSIIPEYFRGVGEKGELLCVQTQVHHLHEAMPFDTIIVTMALKQLKKYSVIFHFEYFRQEHDGSKTKLAFGEQQNIWVVRDKRGNPIPSAFPRPVLEKFKKAIFSAKHP